MSIIFNQMFREHAHAEIIHKIGWVDQIRSKIIFHMSHVST